MNYAAFQGFFTYCYRVQEDGTLKELYVDESLLVNSCHVWSESGPFAPRLEEMKNAAKHARLKK